MSNRNKQRHEAHSHVCLVCGTWIKASNAWGSCERCGADGFSTVKMLRDRAERLGTDSVMFNGFKIKVK